MKKRLLKNILTLTLSTALAFSSTDACVVLAEESENFWTQENSSLENEESEIESDLSVEEMDLSWEADEELEIDSSKADAEENAADDAEERFDISQEQDNTDVSDVMREEETDEYDTNVSTDSPMEEQETELSSEAFLEEESEINAEEETLLSGVGIKYSGKDRDITWVIYEDGKLVLTGNGDYAVGASTIDDGYSKPEWTKKDEFITTAEVNITGITSVCRMFSGCDNLTSVDLSSLDMSNIRNMKEMFGGCKNLTDLDLSGFRTDRVYDMEMMFYQCYSLTSLDLSSFDTGNVSDMTRMFSGCRSLTSLDVSNFDTRKVKDMANMFSNCENLASLDVSNFKTDQLDDVQGMFSNCTNLVNLNLGGFDLSTVKTLDIPAFVNGTIFSGCKNLTYLHTPIGLYKDIELPKGEETDQWYMEDGTACRYLPKDLTDSVWVYKNGYPGDGTMKPMVSFSGVSIGNKEYDGTPNSYTGDAVVKNTSGAVIDVPINFSYTGTLANGSIYAESTQAPSQAGNYTLSFAITGDAAEQYTIQGGDYHFYIRQKTVTITASSAKIELDGQLPVLSELEYTVEGLLGNDSLIVEPQLKYSMDDISTAVADRYDIIPYGADAGNNYNFKYVSGTLTIGTVIDISSEDSGDDSPYEDAERTDLSLSDLKGTLAPIKAKVYDGSPYEPVIKVTVLEGGKKKTLVEGTDYRVVYQNNINAGTGSVVVRGNGIYKGSLTREFEITPKQIKKLKIITGNIAAGDSMAAPIYVYDGAKLLIKGTDYTLSDTTNLTTKNNKVIVTGNGNYTGSVNVKLTVYEGVEPSQIINASNITLKAQMPYTGKAIKENEPTVKIGQTTLTKGKDYKVSYQNNKDCGTAFAIVTGKGAYKGKAVVSFEIIANKQALEIDGGMAKKTYTYNGKLQKPTIKVKAGGKALKQNKDYTISYKQNLHAGTATVTVTGKGNYSGTALQQFQIKQLSISKVSIKGTPKTGLVLTYKNRRLKEGSDYILKYGEVKKNKISVEIIATTGSDFTGSVIKSVKVQ